MSTAPTESPRFLGRYELVHPLGQGGMGEVFLAKISGAAGFEKPCIVKTILPALLKDRQFLDRFHHEAKVLVHLVHSSIAQVYDMGETDGTYYMALEYVAGVDLAYLLEQARAQGVQVPAPVALFLGQRIAEGLGYAHRKTGPDGTPLGIVHRDVSPHNVMVSYDGEVKVIDFGLAKSAARSKYTLPATVMGKLGYMSPEQVRAEPLDHRSDIYSCGVVVWEMLAGRSLIPHGTVGEMMAAMSQPVVPALHEARPDVDAALDAVVRRALEAKPDGRYARSDDLARALNGELVRSGAAVGAEEVGQFVRTLCPEAFAAQRKLVSKVSSSSSHHRTPTPGTGTGQFGTGPQPAAPEGDVSGYGSTVVRTASDVQPTKPRSGGVARPDAVYAEDEETDTGATSVRQPSGGQPSGGQPSGAVLAPRPGSGGHGARKPSRPVPAVEVDADAADAAEAAEAALEERAARRRPMGLYAAIAVLLVIATAAVTALFVRQPAGPAPVTTTPGATVATGKDVQAPVTGAPGDKPGTVVTGTAATGTPGTETGTVATGTPGTETGTVAAATPGTSLADAGVANTTETAAVPAGGQGTPAAAAVPSAGSVVAGSVTPDKPAATEDPRPATAKAPGKKKPVTAPAPAPTVQYVSPAAVLPVVEEDGKYYVERGRGAGLRPGMEVQVLGSAKNGQRPVLGQATVQGLPKALLKKFQGRVYLDLDHEVLGSSGDIYVPVMGRLSAAPGKTEDTGTETEEEQADEEPVKPEKKVLYGTASRQTGFASLTGAGIKVRNLGTTPWTQCTVVKNGRYAAWLGNVQPHEERSVDKDRFKVNVKFDVGSSKVGVFCNEGELVVELR
ncbi:serine/threonine protein kinase [Pyxidicoccus trucidator]|uniref:serine/threonine protein kinase n=1 Tax=Pyxidicoccus trucidator TaxID=2709662 RepID=UPI0013DB344A|nr:serine/threonine-protein kinase [Pyxidicoccus trucidator]